ncbi:MAG TPA: alpha/beta fold hydrolase [Terriglobia bacterium]|nr:alpha/beta fold hydrolase [Terriglobia bacterium]
MMKIAFALLWVAALGTTSLAAPQTTPDLESLARDLTQKLAGRQFDPIVTHFDETMTSAMRSAKLAEFWDGLIGQVGAFQSIAATRVQPVQGYQVVVVTSKFEKATLNLKWVFDSKGRVAGFNVAPVEADAPWTPPDYAKPASFHEQEITVGSTPWQLPGTLTLPNESKGAGPFPAVVLVQGSGPHDQDETISPNKPFKDLAWGLASRNIAVVRYNKRTLQYGKEIMAQGSGLTVNEETVDDARSAVALLSKQPEIDPRRIFVLGHSLGGTLAPRIAQSDAQVAGLVIMAGSTRPLEKVIVEQLKYIASLDGQVTAEAQKRIDAAEQSAKEIESPTLAADTKLNVLGATIPGSYFLDLRGYHPAEVAAQLKIPMLILRGERDYQVTAEDFDGWKKALGGKPEVTLKVYPGLFHLFMPSSSPGTGLGTPADYQKPGHVVEPVIEDIASWIHLYRINQRGGSI